MLKKRAHHIKMKRGAGSVRWPSPRVYRVVDHRASDAARMPTSHHHEQREHRAKGAYMPLKQWAEQLFCSGVTRAVYHLGCVSHTAQKKQKRKSTAYHLHEEQHKTTWRGIYDRSLPQEKFRENVECHGTAHYFYPKIYSSHCTGMCGNGQYVQYEYDNNCNTNIAYDISLTKIANRT